MLTDTFSVQDGIYSPRIPKRETKHRIFVNRSLQLDKIKFFGFDMDYTLAEYKSPDYEELAFDTLKERLVHVGYPEELLSFKYEPSFPIRGLWFDRLYGTFLKIDQFGNILRCMRGFKLVQGEQLRALYPNKFIKYDEKRIEIMNTLFSLPEIHMLSCIINMLISDPTHIQLDKGVKKGNLYMSYTSVYEDVREARDWMHEGELKRRTLADINRYLDRNSKLSSLLDRLRSNGAKVFILTNSGFKYTNAIMTHILELPRPDGTLRKWTSYFDYIVVDAKKPAFFQEGTIMRVVAQETGKRSIGHHMGALETGHVYSGGSCEVFSNLIGARGKDVLYVGDHIFGDILKSKKTVGWRTYLVIPELSNEVYVWKKKKALFDRLQELDNKLENSYRCLCLTNGQSIVSDMNISSEAKPDVGDIQREIREVAHHMEESYGLLGSIFRNGSRHTFFSSQVLRFADIYSFSCINLIYYPLCYMFRAPSMLMPHESTVSHEESPLDSFYDLDSTPCGLARRTKNQVEIIEIFVPCGPKRFDFIEGYINIGKWLRKYSHAKSMEEGCPVVQPLDSARRFNLSAFATAKEHLVWVIVSRTRPHLQHTVHTYVDVVDRETEWMFVPTVTFLVSNFYYSFKTSSASRRCNCVERSSPGGRNVHIINACSLSLVYPVLFTLVSGRDVPNTDINPNNRAANSPIIRILSPNHSDRDLSRFGKRFDDIAGNIFFADVYSDWAVESGFVIMHVVDLIQTFWKQEGKVPNSRHLCQLNSRTNGAAGHTAEIFTGKLKCLVGTSYFAVAQRRATLQNRK
ncbi:Cytosolic purine 5'-nucleotidase, partial [Clonorchis sinensis]